MLAATRDALRNDPSGEFVDVRCGQTFCRIQIDTLVGVGMPWHVIDQRLKPVATGETIIQTEANGARGYVYFTDGDTRLPL